MHHEVLEKNTGKNLELLGKSKILDNFYLAGGTGLALVFGHRMSIDLDFFSSKKTDNEHIVRELKQMGNFEVETLEERTLHGIFEGTKVSFIHYPYGMLRKMHVFHGIQIADPIDIACMKISAISSRGTKKDFVDLYYLLQKWSLSEIIMYFEEKYADIGYNMMHIFKSLSYFADSDSDPDPLFLDKGHPSWITIKRTIQREVKKLV